MAADIDDARIEILDPHQYVVTPAGVLAHLGQFVDRQLAGLVHDRGGDLHLADIVQQAGHTRDADILLAEAQMPRQSHHQRRDATEWI